MSLNDIVKSQANHINKLLVVGHANSGLENVSELLHQAGMAEAKFSKKEQMLPCEITAALLKTHKADTKNFEQVEVSPVWNGLALDLLLGNIDQEPWYWADSDALPLLEYWKSLDSQLSFALVYNSPADLITRVAAQKKSLSASDIDAIFTKWSSYNRALLDFYYNNPQRATLVHSKQIEQNTSVYLQYLQNSLGLPLKTLEVKPESIASQALTKISEQAKSMYSFFAHGMLEKYPEVLEIYEELQSVANLYYDELQAPKISINEAFCEALKLENNYMTKLDIAQKEQELRTEELETKKAELTELLSQNTQTQKENQEQNEENELLLSRLHTVQEELEKLYMQNKTIAEQLTKELDKTKAEKETLHQAAQKKQQELENDKKKTAEETSKLQKELEIKKAELLDVLIKNTQTQKEMQEQNEENELLLSQLHNVQEELERYYIENQKLKEKKQPPRLYGAAERIKQQLSYRLGAKMIENSSSFGGVLAMPFSLMNVVVEFRKEQKAKCRKKLSPIDSYGDAYEAEKVKNHLSYMLGKTMIETFKKPFGALRMPFTLANTYKVYKQKKAKA